MQLTPDDLDCFKSCLYLVVPMKKAILFVVLAACMVHCKPDQQQSRSLDNVNVRLPGEPDRIHPILSRSSPAKDIESYLFWPLAEYDPITGELHALIASELPQGNRIETGVYKGDISYVMTVRPEAKWSDGRSINADDILWTLKAAANPYLENKSWRGLISLMKNVAIYPETNSIEIIVDGTYPNPHEVSSLFNILPRHHFDKNEILDNYTLNELVALDVTTTNDTTLQTYAAIFSSPEYSREHRVTSGPYQLISWETDQAITLEKTVDWWGSDLSLGSRSLPVPDKTSYIFIKDESIAITNLKSGEIDIISQITPQLFNTLKEDSLPQIAFETPEVLQYYFFAMNNRDPELDDARVRKAIALTMDIDGMLESTMYGLGKAVSSPIPPTKSYFLDTPPPTRDIEKAKKLLADAGWVDTNDNGIVDKNINGVREELSLEVLVSSRKLGQTLALQLKEQARPAGIDVQLVQRDNRIIRKDLRSGNYELTPQAARSPLGNYDPYQSWHTDNINTGSNYTQFGNEQSDALIEKIRNENDPAVLSDLYKEFQQLLYDEQPVLFLFAPLERIAFSSRLNVLTSPQRPGYHLYGLSSVDQ